MTKTARLRKSVFLVPIEGLIITPSLKREFRINRVTFVSTGKLPLIRKRLRISRRFSEIRKNNTWWDRIVSCGCVAYLWHRGDPKESRESCLRLVQEELDVLSASQLGWSKRRNGSHPRIAGTRNSTVISTAFLGPQDADTHFSFTRRWADVQNLTLDSEWRGFHNDYGFFPRILKIMRGDVSVQGKWRKLLTRAALMIGRSQCSDDVAQAFLFNMITLEMLLTTQEDKHSTELPKRVDAFLGWVKPLDDPRFRENVSSVYKKRCKLVHEGEADQITIRDLLFTDDLLFNILVNLIRHSSLFNSKKTVVEFSKKVEAEALLGTKARVMPKSFTHLSHTYQEKDYKSI